jgi:hypothetical protein
MSALANIFTYINFSIWKGELIEDIGQFSPH